MSTYDIKHDKCFLCEKEFGYDGVENSDEHIIPNALGGRITLKSFICRSCNNITGYEWDGVLCQNLEGLSVFAGVSRDRGKLPSRAFKSASNSNVEYVIYDDGRIEYRNFSIEKFESGNQTKFNIVAKDRKAAKNALKRLKSETGASINIDEVMLKNLSVNRGYIDDAIKHRVQIDSIPAGKSMTKTILAWASVSGIDIRKCSDALNFLHGTGEPCFGWYSDKDLVVNRPSDEILNCISISANPETGLILGYVEYYNFIKAVICLGKNYSGEKIVKSYCSNPVTKKIFDVKVILYFKMNDIFDIYDYKYLNNIVRTKDLGSLISISQKRHRDIEINEICDLICIDLENKINEEMTDEEANLITENVVTKYLLPFLKHNCT